jgi:predicted DNA-binding transcriptional regulator AlpA
MTHTNHSPRSTEKLALKIPEFCRAFGVGRSKFYELVARRELQPRKSGKQTLIPMGEAERWFSSLPPLELKTPLRRPRRGRG